MSNKEVKQWIAVDLEEYVKLLNMELKLHKEIELESCDYDKLIKNKIEENYNPYKIEDFKEHEHLIKE